MVDASDRAHIIGHARSPLIVVKQKSRATRRWLFHMQWRNQMTKLRLLSAALIAAAMLATPAMARTSHVTSRHLAEDANASAFSTAHHFDIDGLVDIRAPRVGASATAPSDAENCDVGDNPHVC
jgi:hypothetical protein